MMPVLVENIDGRFRVSLYGAPQCSADGETREAALSALKAGIDEQMTRGELVWLDWPTVGLTDLAGRYEYDETLDEIVRDAYRLRDEEKAREFPE